jgi:hypothetical protein
LAPCAAAGWSAWGGGPSVGIVGRVEACCVPSPRAQGHTDKKEQSLRDLCKPATPNHGARAPSPHLIRGSVRTHSWSRLATRLSNVFALFGLSRAAGPSVPDGSCSVQDKHGAIGLATRLGQACRTGRHQWRCFSGQQRNTSANTRHQWSRQRVRQSLKIRFLSSFAQLPTSAECARTRSPRDA